MINIVMRTRYHKFDLELDESPIADALYLSLPLTKEINVWGGEIYFEVPVSMEVRGTKRVMERGEVAYWPEGNALCIFFDRTPISKGTAPEAFNQVVPLGKVLGDLTTLSDLADRTEVTLDHH